MSKRMSGFYDKNDIEIGEGDVVVFTDNTFDDLEPRTLTVKYGIGTYDSGVYKYVGFYVEDAEGYSDGDGYILTEKDNIEIIKSYNKADDERKEEINKAKVLADKGLLECEMCYKIINMYQYLAFNRCCCSDCGFKQHEFDMYGARR